MTVALFQISPPFSSKGEETKNVREYRMPVGIVNYSPSFPVPAEVRARVSKALDIFGTGVRNNEQTNSVVRAAPSVIGVPTHLY